MRFGALQQWRSFSVLLVSLCALGLPAAAGQAPDTNDPASVLRDVLVAACSQKATEFSRSLTARSAEAFTRLTPAARATLLKRFVLLDKPGQPRIEQSASGDATVYCATPEVTSVMEIGKPEIRDNLAYLPLDVKDSADSAGATSHHVVMGMVRENGQWKLLSLGLLLLDIPSLGEEWDRAEMKSNEQSAIASIKRLADAVEEYRKTYTHLPDSLAALGPATKGDAKGEKAGLVDEALATGRKDGYGFRYVIVGANTSGAPAKYEIAAIPGEYGRTGTRSFFRDASGVLHAADHQGAVGSVTDPKLE